MTCICDITIQKFNNQEQKAVKIWKLLDQDQFTRAGDQPQGRDDPDRSHWGGRRPPLPDTGRLCDVGLFFNFVSIYLNENDAVTIIDR